MNVLVVGSGGREHTIVWKIAQSSKVQKIYCAPGNGGIANVAECVDIMATDISGLLDFSLKKKIDLVIVGPEAPLVDGIVDVFWEAGIKIFGPTKTAAQLEGSKIFAKEFMARHNIPTAAFAVFSDADLAVSYLSTAVFPVVVKADGLAAGKGVVICETKEQAAVAVDQIMTQRVFKEAGARLVIEECLRGEEVSVFAVSDGTDYVILDSAQDHKRAFDQDQGPNTGGMGAYSPALVLTPELRAEVENTIIAPTISGMAQEGNPFTGLLYAGLMITAQGPKVLEYNVRFGDPETQVVLPRMKTDLFDLMMASCDGRLKSFSVDYDPRVCVCVVMASGGYPGSYENGKEIKGLSFVEDLEDQIVFHAGTKKDGDKIVTAGGRVLGIVGLGANIKKAIERTYDAAKKISFEKGFYRNDIGYRALRRL